ncbi:Cys-tRNA(Pro) deacylase [Ruminococcus flavefaciens]|uniref:Cys-tRNA(Pro)/Cys-tRNA(Cys) deacylase n=1 Tax=Ruminococcus flavefaciens TaxID=1265 RepID=A0A1K1NYT4_RUMFL|nr:Cys-tRNA(Pro) deacylase [Ruminococcus flavefaciens]SFW40403.1 Cys-tRNA(Pro)/Cys-tRNA(Cys) deacylase [Ruminococcus flavefaciens]
MGKELKTNAMRFLDKSKIEYTVQTYECDEFIDGIHTAEKLGQPLDETFKTLVAQGKSGSYYCFLIPVALELDMKKAAKSVGEKSVELIHVKDITKITGYVRGGCTPIGMKKQFMTVVHESAAELPMFFISGGRIGTQIHLSPQELVKAIRGKFEDIIMQ